MISLLLFALAGVTAVRTFFASDLDEFLPLMIWSAVLLVAGALVFEVEGLVDRSRSRRDHMHVGPGALHPSPHSASGSPWTGSPAAASALPSEPIPVSASTGAAAGLDFEAWPYRIRETR